MADVSKIKLGNEDPYNIKDLEARALIEGLQEQIDFYHPPVVPGASVGVQIDYDNNVSTRLENAIDSITGNAADFDNFEVYNKRTRCTVADDGTINHFFGETGYKEDGTDGQVMVYQPKFYYKTELVSGTKQSSGNGYDASVVKYFISNKEDEGYKVHPAFIDNNGQEVDYYLVAAFDGTLVAPSSNSVVGNSSTGKLSSFAAAISGSSYPSTAYASTNMTRANFEAAAQRRGSNWHICTYKIQAAEQLLMMIEFGTMNLQGTSNDAAIGGGLLQSATTGNDFKNNNSTNTGYRLGLGGSTDRAVKTSYNNYTSPIVYRGLENPWGNVSKWVNGLNYDGDKKIAYIANTNSFTDDTTTGYTSCGFLLAGSNGFVKAMGYNEDMDWVLLPSKVEGQSTDIVGDYYYQNSGWRVAALRGHWNFDSSSAPQSGTFYWALNYPSSNALQGVGARAAYCPQATENSYSTNLTKISSLA